MRNNLLAVSIVAITVLIALLDFWTSAEFIGSILFTLPLALCVLQRSKRLLWGTAIAVAVLTIGAEFWGFHRAGWANSGVTFANRGLLVASLLTLTVFVDLWIQKSQKAAGDSAEIERQRSSLASQNDQLETLVNAAKHDIDVLQNTEKRLEHTTLELKIKHQILNSVVEGTTDPIYIRDLNNRFTLANSACARLFGYSVDEIVGKNMRELLPNETYVAVAQSDQEIVRTGATCTIEEIAEIDGITRFFLTTKGPDRDTNQNIIGTIGISREITQRKKSEEQLATANKELDAFAYSVAHDLRAPIRHIDGFSRLLVERLDGSVDEDVKRYLKTIQGSARDMGLMVDDLLNLSRVARMELKLQATSLNALVEQVLKVQDLTDRHIEWKIADLPLVQCDPILVKQVFVNLLSNAVKFTRTRPSAIIEVGTIDVDGQTATYVRDNGVGFNMKYKDRLFGVFQRLHTQEEFEGTGVGLATVQRIVQKHGGRIWAEAEVNKGATFYFTLETPAHTRWLSKGKPS